MPRTLSGREIQKLIERKLRGKLVPKPDFKFGDGRYYCPPLTEVKLLVKANYIDKRVWTREKYDCDDFAIGLKYMFTTYAYRNGKRRHPYAIGMLWGRNLVEGHHAINVIITDRKQVLFIEPQNDRVFNPRPRDKNIYFMYF